MYGPTNTRAKQFFWWLNNSFTENGDSIFPGTYVLVLEVVALLFLERVHLHSRHPRVFIVGAPCWCMKHACARDKIRIKNVDDT